MQQLQQLPKADKFFKQIVDKRVESYIETSTHVADEFMRQRNQAENKATISDTHLQDLKRQLGVLKAVQMTRVEVEGVRREEIGEMVKRYQGIISEIQEKLQTKMEKKPLQTQDQPQLFSEELNSSSQHLFKQTYPRSSFYQSGLISNHQTLAQRNISHSKIYKLKQILKTWGLRSLQFITVLLMIVCLIKVLFFQ